VVQWSKKVASNASMKPGLVSIERSFRELGE